MSEKARYSQYSKIYKLPVNVIETLQKLKILPAELPSIWDVRPEDHDFLQRYSLIFKSFRYIRSSIFKCTPEDRLLFLQPPAKDWTDFVLCEYMQAYRERKNKGAGQDDCALAEPPLPTQAIYAALPEQFGVQITTEIRSKVDSIRRAAFRRVAREQ